MSKVFRAVFLKEFMAAWGKGQLVLPPSAPTKEKDVTEWRRKRYLKDWIVYARVFGVKGTQNKPFGGPDSVVEYLGRYTHKTAISNHRLLDVGPEKVSFRYKDYRKKGAQKTMALTGLEFLRRFCQHILPPRFRRIRHYGIFANTKKAKSLAAARASLNVDPDSVPKKKPRKERIRDLLEKQHGCPIADCPDCGAKDSLIRIPISPSGGRGAPNARAPPASFVFVPVK
jgi:hypothetical protein